MNYLCKSKTSNILVPLRRPSLDFSKAAFVISLKAEVKAPEAAKPARKDCKALIRSEKTKFKDQN